MLQPFEVVTAKLLPTIRARLAQVLLDDYKMTQVEIAKRLGITQAAVSHYKTASRGLDEDLVRLFPEIDTEVRALAAQMADGITRTAQMQAFNGIVDRLMNTQRFCAYHKSIAAIDPACNICFPNPPRP